MVILKNWDIRTIGAGLGGPCCITDHLCGEAYGHPRYDDGHWIRTSEVKKVEGRTITCVSRQYFLEGSPNREYMEYLADRGLTYDPADPLKLPGRD